MWHQKGIVMAAGTVLCALLIGFVMQSSETAKKRYGPLAISTLFRPDKADPARAAAATSPRTEFAASNTKVAHAQTALEPRDILSFVETECDVVAKARVMAGAMVQINATADCLADEKVNIHHAGMLFSVQTDQRGRMSVTVPALTEPAVFIIAFANGDGSVVEVNVRDLADYDRVVLQRDSDSALGIHAREFGADYGEIGHVWSGARGEAPTKGGFLTILGDPNQTDGITAEIYSFPTAKTDRTGEIDLSVEAEVTEATCGQQVEAKILQLYAGGRLSARDFALSMPECDKTGTFLQLNNLFQDLKINEK